MIRVGIIFLSNFTLYLHTQLVSSAGFAVFIQFSRGFVSALPFVLASFAPISYNLCDAILSMYLLSAVNFECFPPMKLQVLSTVIVDESAEFRLWTNVSEYLNMDFRYKFAEFIHNCGFGGGVLIVSANFATICYSFIDTALRMLWSECVSYSWAISHYVSTPN